MHGFNIIDVQHVDVHGGSIIVTAAMRSSKWKSGKSVDAALRTEQEFGISDDATYQNFATRVEDIRNELKNTLHTLTAEGKSIAAYGAPAKGNTLLNACGVSAAEICWACDTNSEKQGKILGGI